MERGLGGCRRLKLTAVKVRGLCGEDGVHVHSESVKQHCVSGSDDRAQSAAGSSEEEVQGIEILRIGGLINRAILEVPDAVFS